MNRAKLLEIFVNYKIIPKIIDKVAKMYGKDTTVVKLGEMSEGHIRNQTTVIGLHLF